MNCCQCSNLASLTSCPASDICLNSCIIKIIYFLSFGCIRSLIQPTHNILCINFCLILSVIQFDVHSVQLVFFNAMQLVEMPSSAHVYASANKVRKEKTHNKIHEPYNNPKHPPPLVKHPTTNIRDSNSAAKDESPTSRSSCSFIHTSREYLRKLSGNLGPSISSRNIPPLHHQLNVTILSFAMV